MENTESRLYFASDYMEGAHPAIMKKLMETNLEKTVGYGQDPYTEDAKEKIREACNAPEADVFLLVGGTQTNATVIDALLKSYQGVVAADTGHIATHESGAIEFGGHKVLTVTIIKQHGALLAKGRIAGIQFGELFTDGLYLRIGKPAMEAAEQIKDALKKYGDQLSLDTPTNQIFCIVSNEVMKKIAQDVEFGFWEKYDETHSVIRFATSWATTMEDTQKLIQILEKNK